MAGGTTNLTSSLGARFVVAPLDLEKPSRLVYAGTKAAVEILVKNWAALLGPHGIRVNASRPV